jgi:hypothetical protein
MFQLKKPSLGYTHKNKIINTRTQALTQSLLFTGDEIVYLTVILHNISHYTHIYTVFAYPRYIKYPDTNLLLLDHTLT